MEILGSLIFFLLLLGLVFFLLWLWTILDIIQSRFYDSDKLVWLVVVIFLPVLGTLLYLLIGRRQRMK